MAGYSGTPLPKKLGIKEQFRIALLDLPRDVKAELKTALDGCNSTKDGPVDFAMIFVKTAAELKEQFPRYAKQLAPAGMLWVSWPKKASGLTSDLNENEVRRIGLGAGLVDVKVCAVSEIWSGLKFVIRLKDRDKRG
ncbi:MAG TPA: hypothetical protein VNZ03_19440 [Terriglobales bacterium]|jgi:hypothetical protein|nr:hypothetical protein [Terriglobales bacterium]